MKKFLCLILAVCLSLGLAACGDKDIDKNSFESAKEYVDGVKSEREQKEVKEREQFESNKKTINEEVSVSECTLKLKEYSIVDSTIFDNTKCIAISFDFTNNSGTEKHFADIIYEYSFPVLTLYQDGVKLNCTSSKLSKDAGTIIKSGATIEVVEVFALQNETSNIEVELKHYDREISSCIIKLN